MAYSKIGWKDRVVERPRTFNIINNPDGTITLEPSEGIISEPGTPILAAYMNHIEKGIEDTYVGIMAELASNYEVTLTDENGSQLDHYTVNQMRLFFEVISKQNINVKNLNGKAFVKILIDTSDLIEGQVSVDYDSINVGSYQDETQVIERVASTNINVEILGEGFSLLNASYDNLHHDFGGSLSSITFNNDGTKIYRCGYTEDIYEYSLSAPYDITTATLVAMFDAGSQLNQLESITFNNDGTKLFALCSTNDSVYQYSLSTPFDLSTISYDNISFSVSTQGGLPKSLRFNKVGNKLFIQNYDKLYQYSLSTPFDLSTISYDNISFNLNGQGGNFNSIEFNKIGNKLFALSASSPSIHQYSLSTPFDLSTISYDNISFNVSGQSSSPRSIKFNKAGDKLFLLDYTSGDVYRYSTEGGYNGTVYIGVEY